MRWRDEAAVENQVVSCHSRGTRPSRANSFASGRAQEARLSSRVTGNPIGQAPDEFAGLISFDYDCKARLNDREGGRLRGGETHMNELTDE